VQKLGRKGSFVLRPVSSRRKKFTKTTKEICPNCEKVVETVKD